MARPVVAIKSDSFNIDKRWHHRPDVVLARHRLLATSFPSSVGAPPLFHRSGALRDRRPLISRDDKADTEADETFGGVSLTTCGRVSAENHGPRRADVTRFLRLHGPPRSRAVVVGMIRDGLIQVVYQLESLLEIASVGAFLSVVFERLYPLQQLSPPLFVLRR